MDTEDGGSNERAVTVVRVLARVGVVGTLAAAVSLLLMAAPAQAAFTAGITGTTLTITGDGVSDHLALRLQPSAPNTLQVDVGDNGTADFSFDRNGFDHITVAAGGGNDVVRIDQVNGVFTDTEVTTLSGGKGNDTLLGGSGSERLIGGDGNDVVDGNEGDDIAFLGTGNDTFNWDPGDASDVVEGQDGTDTLRFNGANVNETVDASANGARLRFTRDVANIVTDTDGVEKVRFNALGGADRVTVHDLTGTDVTNVTVDLGSPSGTPGGDGAADTVTVEGTNGPDAVGLVSAPGAMTVTGLATTATVLHPEQTDDLLQVNTLAGDDEISSTPLSTVPMTVNVDGGADTDTSTANGTNAADTFSVTADGTAAFVSSDGVTGIDIVADDVVLNGFGGDDHTSAAGNLAAITKLIVHGGKGADTLLGGNGPDTIIGGDGTDFVDGNQGDDLALLAAGRDTFNWDPGDGNDVVEGQDGIDTLQFNGANVNERIDVSANGQRMRFTRDVANIVMDTDGVERVRFNAQAGTDLVTVHDLTGTDVTNVTVDLGSPAGTSGGDGVADVVAVEGTGGADTVGLAPSAGAMTVTGLVPAVTVLHPESTLDTVQVNTLTGNDRISSTPLGGVPMLVNVDGGADTDAYTANGTNGDDTFSVTANGTAAFVSGDGLTGVNVVTEDVVLNGFGGDDQTSGLGNLAAITRLTVHGGDGADIVLGGNGPDSLFGGDGNDVVDGNQGDDLAFLGTGNDTFNWDPGDGSDTVEGQDGTDTLRFNGANINEKIDVSANGQRLRFTRDVASIFMDTDGVEKVRFNALGGTDLVTVHDLTGTDVGTVTVNLAGTLGGASGDGAADDVVVEGTAGKDAIDIGGSSAAGVTVSGLVPTVRVLHPEFANDRLDVNTLAGNDTVDSSGLGPGVIQLFVDGVAR